jgi:DNA-3-methyladenine glycosylase II
MQKNIYQTSISLANKPYFSWAECHWFLDRGHNDCLHSIGANYVRKAFFIENKYELLELSFSDNNLIVSGLLGNIPADNFIAYVLEWLDVERNIAPFYQLLQADPQLAPLAQNYQGLRLVGIPSLAEALCWAVIGQQINLKFAYLLKRRLTETYGQFIDYESDRYYIFPEPNVLAQLPPQALRTLQFSQKKAEYIVEIARQIDQKIVTKDLLAGLATAEAQQLLCSIRGVGEWTANYTLMKCLHRLSCITHGDAGLYQALHSLKHLPKKPEKSQVLALFAPYAGWEAYLTLYLWRSLATKPTGS